MDWRIGLGHITAGKEGFCINNQDLNVSYGRDALYQRQRRKGSDMLGMLGSALCQLSL
jgi:hypothetical protein